MQRLLILVFTSGSVISYAQPPSGNLCQESYYSEKEGAEKLARVAQNIHSLQDWKNHADSIRSQIKRGMELEKFPTKLPLNPLFRNKKNLNGYSVESVAYSLATN